jgi:hypothetical protein
VPDSFKLAADTFTEALLFSSDESPRRAEVCHNIAFARYRVYELTFDVSELDSALAFAQAAANLCAD